MYQSLRLLLLIALAACLLLASATNGLACSSASKEASDPRLLLAGADVIVRAVAVTYHGHYEGKEPAGEEVIPPLVEFKVLEVLKGEDVPELLHAPGQLIGVDDFNPPTMPLHSIRPTGRGGSCYAYYYKKGGEFLLVLRKKGSELTPYWASMAATNQQLRGADDPWLHWVRQQLLSAGASEGRQM